MADAATIAQAQAVVLEFYRSLLRREPGSRNDPTGLADWTAALVNLIDTKGFTFEQAKAEIFRAFINSDEYKALQQQSAGVTTMPTIPSISEGDFDAAFYTQANPDFAAAAAQDPPPAWLRSSNPAWTHFQYVAANETPFGRRWRNKSTGQTYTGATPDPAPAPTGGGSTTTSGGVITTTGGGSTTTTTTTAPADTGGGFGALFSHLPTWAWIVVAIVLLLWLSSGSGSKR